MQPKKPNTLHLKSKPDQNGVVHILATITPVFDGEKYRFMAELHREYAGCVVTFKRLSDAMEYAELAFSPEAKAA